MVCLDHSPLIYLAVPDNNDFCRYCILVSQLWLCINVGTEFMAKLHEQLKYFVAKKVSTDRLWQGVRIYLSGHEVI